MRIRCTRRTFLASAGAAMAGLTLGGPSFAEHNAKRLSPLETLNIAGIGVGGRGGGNVRAMSDENIVALCDVDDRRAANAYERWPDAARYTDFRRLFDDMANDIDAVVISTPDHTHAVIALAAMELGKHVYLEKPIGHSIKENRALLDAARRYGVVTQMGNQGMAHEGLREVCEMIWTGLLGDVRTVHVWDDSTDMYPHVERPTEEQEIPEHLDWDLWLGPAPERPYHEDYAPHRWRGWWDFGAGALGDMGCHLMNPAYMALQLGAPDSVEVVREYGLTEESPPESSVIRFDFPARETMDAVTLYWYDGGELPEPPEDTPDEIRELIPTTRGGVIYEGSKGNLFTHRRDAENRVLWPEELEEERADVPELLPRSIGHHAEFIQACKGGVEPWSNFEYAAPFTDTVMLGNVALRAGEKIEWDGEKVTNVEAANEFLHREYRDGWTLG